MRASDIRNAPFDGAVVWTHVCHIGSVGRMWVAGDIVSTFGSSDVTEEYVVPKERSVALAVIEAGAAAYIAPLGPNFGAQSAIEQAIASETGIPLGDVLRRAYHDVVMDTNGHPEQIGLHVRGRPRLQRPDGFHNFNSPHHRALYGDPMLRPFGDHRSPATVKITAEESGDGVKLAFELAKSGYLGRTWYGNRGSSGRGRIYEVIPLDGDPQEVELTKVQGRRADGEAFPISSRTVLLERIDGRTFLHVQFVTDDPDALRTKGSRVTASLELSE